MAGGIPENNRETLRYAEDRRKKGFATGVAARKSKPSEWIIFWNSASSKRVNYRVQEEEGEGWRLRTKFVKKKMSRAFFLRTFEVIQEESF